MITQEELDEIEISNQYAKEAVEKGEALKRLLENEDYKLVISEGYMKSYPQDLGLAIASNTGAYDTDRLLKDLNGINSFVSYIFRISNMYDEARQTLKDNEDYIAENSEE